MTDDDLIRSEQPNWNLEELEVALRERFTGGERDGPILDELRLYLCARLFQGWTYPPLVSRVVEWGVGSDRYAMKLLKSLAEVGARPHEHVEVWTDGDTIEVVESQTAKRLARRRAILEQNARVLAGGGRLGDAPSGFVPEPVEGLDFGSASDAWFGRSEGVKRAKREKLFLILGILFGLLFTFTLIAALI